MTLWILEIDEIKTVPNVPLSHPFVERFLRDSMSSRPRSKRAWDRSIAKFVSDAVRFAAAAELTKRTLHADQLGVASDFCCI